MMRQTNVGPQRRRPTLGLQLTSDLLATRHYRIVVGAALYHQLPERGTSSDGRALA